MKLSIEMSACDDDGCGGFGSGVNRRNVWLFRLLRLASSVLVKMRDRTTRVAVVG